MCQGGWGVGGNSEEMTAAVSGGRAATLLRLPWRKLGMRATAGAASSYSVCVNGCGSASLPGFEEGADWPNPTVQGGGPCDWERSPGHVTVTCHFLVTLLPCLGLIMEKRNGGGF